MEKDTKRAELQILQLVKTLSDSRTVLNNEEFISVLKAIRSICVKKNVIRNIIRSVEALNRIKLNQKLRFTQRELQVLRLVGEDLKNNQIALRLELSVSTIETHRKNIRKKLKITGTNNLTMFTLIFSLQDKRHR
jgi:DNA-binding NarL/FixJ family response regulator